MTETDLHKYINDGLTVKDICAITNRSPSAVRYWFNRYNLTPYSPTTPHRCRCGETNPAQFYGSNKQVCKHCANRRSSARVKYQKLRAISHKGGSCTRCGYDASPSALEFHHTTPSEKEYAWDEMRKMSWHRVLEELDKCVLVCANCHREIHDEMRQLSVTSK